MFACVGCNIALYYYGGFCYLLLRRYLDAARAFNTVLNYISRCAHPPCPHAWHRLCGSQSLVQGQASLPYVLCPLHRAFKLSELQSFYRQETLVAPSPRSLGDMLRLHKLTQPVCMSHPMKHTSKGHVGMH
jgi:hypothetical protein